MASGALDRQASVEHTERDFEIEAYGIRFPATKAPRCLYDPTNARLKG